MGVWERTLPSVPLCLTQPCPWLRPSVGDGGAERAPWQLEADGSTYARQCPAGRGAFLFATAKP
eukprot:1803034-Alexandrium_andersonii.AAC.1